MSAIELKYKVRDGAPFRFFWANLMRMKTPKSRDAFILGSLSSEKDWTSIPGLDKFLANKAKRSDRKFFIKLGRSLSGKRKDPFSPKEKFLLSRWDTLGSSGSEPIGLKHFTDQAACEFTNATTKAYHDLDAYRKMRKRLGLKPEKPAQVRRCKVSGNKIDLFQSGQNP
jgi:hypothetical protein